MVLYASDGTKFNNKYSLQAYEYKVNKPKRVKKTNTPKKLVKKTKVIQTKDKYLNYTTRAKQRNMPFELSIEQFYSLLELPCYYCGDPVSGTLDRLNSKLGYTLDNVKPSCWPCNRMKFTNSEQDFLAHVCKIYKFKHGS